MIWQARKFEFRFPRPTVVVGIINVTPDSFSDGGQFFSVDAAVNRGMELIRQGADILDVGGESTRPGAEPVSVNAELERVLPVVERLARAVSVPISIDTYKPDVAAAALASGASVVNDVRAVRADRGMARLVAESGAGYVVMHMQGTPQSMQSAPEYRDIVSDVRSFFAESLTRLEESGVAATQVALDVGIGFGKTVEHNLELLSRLRAFSDLRRPLWVGVSRKSFIGRIGGASVEARLPGSLAATCLAVEQGAACVRTHDVAATVQALRITEAILGVRPTCPCI